MSYNTPVRHLQGGSVEETGSGGTQLISSGGSIQVASGAVINIAAGGSLVNAGGVALASGVTLTNPTINVITLGGTTAKWAFGTAGLTSGIGTLGIPGFTRALSANANPVLGENQSSGSAAFVFVDLSLSGAGSVIFRLGSAGGALWNANGTISWSSFGT